MEQQKQVERCESTECSAPLIGDTYYDHFYKKRLCPSCFQRAFAVAKDHGIGEWFQANYDKSDYSEEFWKSVGAFQDLKHCDPGSVYK